MLRHEGPSEPPAVSAQDEPPAAPPDRILAAALVCMERDGIEATGIRDIAREAGVNSAAINYYFRSKDNLIRLALERSLENAFGDIISQFDALRSDGVSTRAALEHVIEDYVRHARDFPRLAYAHLREALVDQRYDGVAVKRVNSFLEALLARLVADPASERARALRVLLVQAWGNLFALGLLPQLFEPFLALDFSNGKCREEYVRLLLAPILAAIE